MMDKFFILAVLDKVILGGNVNIHHRVIDLIQMMILKAYILVKAKAINYSCILMTVTGG